MFSYRSLSTPLKCGAIMRSHFARSFASGYGSSKDTRHVRVEETRSTVSRFQNKVVVQHVHELIGDEPSSFPGGGSTGPCPYGFLLTSLGTCTSSNDR